MKDSDGDGLTNGDELGDPCCSWSFGGVARRTNLNDLSDPGNSSSLAPFVSATTVSNIYGFKAIPTFHSVALRWKMPDDRKSVICQVQIQMSTLNSLGYRTVINNPYNVNNFTRYNLDENKTYSFRILPYNKFLGYSNSGVGNQAVLFITTTKNPYKYGIGDNCPSTVIKWSELYGNLTEYIKIPNDTFIESNETTSSNSSSTSNETLPIFETNSTTDSNTTIDISNSTVDSNSTFDSENSTTDSTINISNSTLDSNSTIDITSDCNSTILDNSNSTICNNTFNGTSLDNSSTSDTNYTHIEGPTLDSNSTFSDSNTTVDYNSTVDDSNPTINNSTNMDNSTIGEYNSTIEDNSTLADDNTVSGNSPIDGNETITDNITIETNNSLVENNTFDDNSTFSDNSTFTDDGNNSTEHGSIGLNDSNSTLGDNPTLDTNNTDANSQNVRSLRVSKIKRKLLSLSEDETFEFSCSHVYETRFCLINTTSLIDSHTTTRTCSYSIVENSTLCNSGSCMVCVGGGSYCNSTINYSCDEIVIDEFNSTICSETTLSISTTCANLTFNNTQHENSFNNTMDEISNSTMDSSTVGDYNSTDNSTLSDNNAIDGNETITDNTSIDSTIETNNSTFENNTFDNSTFSDNSTFTDDRNNSTEHDNSVVDNNIMDGNTTLSNDTVIPDNTTMENCTNESNCATDNSTLSENNTFDNSSITDNSTLDSNVTLFENSTVGNNTNDYNSTWINNCTSDITREDIYDCFTTIYTTECVINSTYNETFYSNNTDCVVFGDTEIFSCDNENCTSCANGDRNCISILFSSCGNETYLSDNSTTVTCNQISINSTTECSLNRTIINVTNCFGDNSTFVITNSSITSNTTTNATNSTDYGEEEDESFDLPPEMILVIPENYTVILDVIPPKLDVLHVFGCLIFSDELDLELNFKSMIVTGSLQIGNETHPHQHEATITLHGDRYDSRALIGSGIKNIVVTSGGTMSLHGKRHTVSWTLLAKSANAGDTIIYLMEETSWEVGDEIVLASTDYFFSQAERRIISIRYNGSTFGFTSPLVYGHYSGTEYFTKSNGTIVEFEERGEVGLLTRNIKIRGDVSSDSNMFGGHTLFFKTAQYVKLNNVEFTRMGQLGIPGRYPIYFQMFGDADTSYISKVSIYDSYQRSVALQATNRLHVEGVVAYNISGHAFFLEDGVEEYNIFENNLGILTKSIPDSRSIFQPDNNDKNPATFFITNPNNVLIGNRAAGSEAFGFWYRLDSYSSGASASPYIRPNRWYWGKFANNTAHSNNQNGVMIQPEFYPCSDPKKELNERINCGSDQNPWTEVEFESIKVWKNRQNGQYSQVQGKISLKDSIFADNPVGYTVVSILLSEQVLNGGIFIGYTQNKGNTNGCNDGHCYRCGTDFTNPSSHNHRSIPIPYSRANSFTGILYQRDGKSHTLQNIEFFNYVDYCERKLNSIDIRNDASASLKQGDYNTKNLYFHNANVMYLLAGISSREGSISDVYRHSVIVDTDGTLSRNITLPKGFKASGARIIPDNKILVNPSLCFFVKDWNAHMCDESVNFKRFEITTSAITNGVERARVNSTNGYSEFLNGRLQSWGEWYYRALYLDDGFYRYSIDWTGVAGTPDQVMIVWQGTTTLSISVSFLKWGPLQIRIVYADGSPTKNLSPSNQTDGSTHYDCKTNLVTFPVKTQATVYVEDATYVPPEMDCITFDNTLCSNRSNCGGPRRGKCVGINECACRWGWYTETCSTFHCVHRNWCSGRGTCVGPNMCACFPGFSGLDCSSVETFELFNRVLAFGDIHLRTVDSQQYTFNSVGEFYLYKSNELTLQGRLMKCTAESKTSCMKGISFMSGTDRISILSDGKTDVKVLVNNVQIYLNETKNNVAPVESDTKLEIPNDLQALIDQIKFQRDPNTNEIVNITQSQLAFKEPESPILVLNGGSTITQEDDSSFYMVGGVKIFYKSVIVHFSGDFKGQIRLRNDGLGWLSVSFAPSKDTNFTGPEAGGLYGTLDGNSENEFTMRDGTILQTPSSEDIHQVFGESWRVRKHESFFTYFAGSEYEDINILDFKPIMRASTDNATLQSLAEKACSSLGLTDVFYETCMFDVLSTGLIEYAMASAIAVALDSCGNNASCTTVAVVMCPNFCSLNGKCVSGICHCDLGYIGDDCGISVIYLNVFGIIIGSVIGGYLIVLLFCVTVIVSLILCSGRYKSKNVARMVSIVPTLDHRDELRSIGSNDHEDQRVEMIERTMGTVVFKK